MPTCDCGIVYDNLHNLRGAKDGECPRCYFARTCMVRVWTPPPPSEPPTPLPKEEWQVLTSFVSRMDQIGFQGLTKHTGEAAAVEALLSKRYLYRFYVPDQATALYNVTNQGRAFLRDNGYSGVREFALYTKTVLNHYAGIKVLKKQDLGTLSVMVERDGFLVREGDSYELTEAGWKFLGRTGPTDRYHRTDVV